MRREGFTLVEVMIVAGIIGLLAAIAIPNLLAVKKAANEAAAKANVRTLSTSAETFMTSHGHYPDNLADFRNYLSSVDNYCADLSGAEKATQGYNYACTSDTSGYTFAASPMDLNRTGSVTYTATTGGVLTP